MLPFVFQNRPITRHRLGSFVCDTRYPLSERLGLTVVDVMLMSDEQLDSEQLLAELVALFRANGFEVPRDAIEMARIYIRQEFELPW